MVMNAMVESVKNHLKKSKFFDRQGVNQKNNGKKNTPKFRLRRIFFRGTNNPKKSPERKTIGGTKPTISNSPTTLPPKKTQTILKRFFFKNFVQTKKTVGPKSSKTQTKLRRLTRRSLTRLLSQDFNLLRLRLLTFHAHI